MAKVILILQDDPNDPGNVLMELDFDPVFNKGDVETPAQKYAGKALEAIVEASSAWKFEAHDESTRSGAV